MRALLTTFSWQELRHHPWRHAAAGVAVMLGVALALSVHLINASALAEFAQAVRTVSGQPDLQVSRLQGRLDEALYARIASDPDVAVASPVLELVTLASNAQGERVSLRVLGVDALNIGAVAPALWPQPAPAQDRLAMLAPNTVFLNAAARAVLGDAVQLQAGLMLTPVHVAGHVSAAGAPLAVMDLGAAQDLFDQGGHLSRIDLRLRAGVNPAAWARTLLATPNWPAGVRVNEPGERTGQLNQLSQAYRVNLTVLSLMALFTGAFLVFSVLSLSVSQRAQQLALLGVLGLSARQRLTLVLWESLALGVLGSAAGVALGGALAALALRLMGGDLGGGYFAGSTPTLQWDSAAAVAYALLGVLAALVGGWWPAQQARHLPLAATLKGLGAAAQAPTAPWISLVLIATSAALARAPAISGVPVAAYLAIGCGVVGGITALPWLVGWALNRLAPLVQRHALALLALERARRQRHTAAVAVSGVVAALSLAVALTVMVASFRNSVSDWLTQVLPADLYVRSTPSAAAADTVYFTPALVQAVARLDGVRQLEAQRQLALTLDAARPPVTLLARPLGDPARRLPLVSGPLSVPTGRIGIYVSEAMLALHGAQLGAELPALSEAFRALALSQQGQVAHFFVAGVWRDYARQAGSIAMDARDFQALTGDLRVNDLALWLTREELSASVQSGIHALAQGHSPDTTAVLDMASAGQLRATSLRIFDRSFAVTYWLQAVAIGMGLFGVAASFSAQVLARRKEFGLLAHLGLTRRQILKVVALEGLAWTALGALMGLGLGLAVALVLVDVINPQSFHWSMDLTVPWARLLVLCTAVVLAGTLTAWLAGRAAAARPAVLAVKEDW